MGSRDKLLGAFGVHIKKQYGITVQKGMYVQKIRRLSTGSIALDFASGGGVPVGRTIELIGDKSSSKTTTACRIAGLAQKLCANCLRPARNYRVEEIGEDKETGETLYEQFGECDCVKSGIAEITRYYGEINKEFSEREARYKVDSYEPFRVVFLDVEGTLDFLWAKKVGFDTRVILYHAPASAEEGIDIYDGLLSSGGVDMLILDSLAALTPKFEAEESIERKSMGLQARLVNSLVRKVQASTNRVVQDFGRQVTQIWINQLRKNMEGQDVRPGGRGQEFATSLEVMFRAGYIGKDQKAELDFGLTDKQTMQFAEKIEISFVIEKNKTGPAKMTGMFTLQLTGERAGQLNEVEILNNLLAKFGELDGNSASGYRLGTETFKKQYELTARLAEPETFARWREFCLRRMLATVA